MSKTVRTRLLETLAAALADLAGDDVPAVHAVVWGSRGDRNDQTIGEGVANGALVLELAAGDDEIADNAEGFNVVHKRFEAGVVVYLPADLPDGLGGQLTPDDVAGRVHQAVAAVVEAQNATGWGGLAIDSEEIGGGGAFPSPLAGSESFVALRFDYRHLRGDLTTAA